MTETDERLVTIPWNGSSVQRRMIIPLGDVVAALADHELMVIHQREMNYLLADRSHLVEVVQQQAMAIRALQQEKANS